ncbi:MAG: helix-turn-helix domain-containing protein [Bdellovibrionia bacterium]
MPWKDVRPMDERVRFIMRLLDGERMTDLCREYGVTRKTGYKFLERYNQFGMEGLNNQSRRPYHLARKTCDEIEKLIINLKGIYPTWGPKKLKAKLAIVP